MVKSTIFNVFIWQLLPVNYNDQYRAGRKRGKGIFLYEEGVKERSENPGFLELVNKIKVEPKVE